MIRVLAGAAFLLAGCASTVAKIIPIGEPVTTERCQALDMKKMGFDDGKIGQRSGDKFEFWVKDCAAVRVTLNRAAYDEGYSEGLKFYCSCENGFDSGVREEIAEIKTQRVMCAGKQLKEFLAGHEKGSLQSKNEELVKKAGQFKWEYNDPNIQAMAKASCSATATP